MQPSGSLKSSVVRGVGWMAGARLVVRLLGFISTLILARLLVPADFGVVAVTMSIVAFVELFTTFGFDMALIQKQDLTPEYLNTVWTLTFLLYLGVGLVLFVLAVPAADFYNDPRIRNVMLVVGGSEIVKGFANIGTAIFRRNLDFRRDFLLQVNAKIAGFIIGVPLAFALRNYWALVWGMVASNVATVVTSYVMHEHRPRFTLAHMRELLGFSIWLLFNNTFNFLRTRSSDLIIGRLLGTQSVGVFSMAFQIATMPTTETVAPVNRVTYPTYCRLFSDPPALQRAFVRVIGVIALVTVPLSLGLAAIADFAVPVLLGDKWLAAIPILQALAIYSGTNCLQTNAGSLLTAIGRPYAITSGSVIQVGSLVILLVIAGHRGSLELMAWTFAVHSLVINSVVTYYLVWRHAQISPLPVLASVWRPIVASVAMFAGIELLTHSHYWPHGTPQAVQLVLAILVGFGIYAALLPLLWYLSGRPAGAELEMLEIVMARFRRRGGRAGGGAGLIESLGKSGDGEG